MEPMTTDQMTLLDHFYHWENQRPDQVFMRQPFGPLWTDITWREVGAIVRRMAAALQRLDLQPGDVVATYSKNCYHWVLADLAIMMGGFVSAPLYPNLTGPQLAEVLKLSGAKLLFVGKLDDWAGPVRFLPEGIPTIAFPHYNGNDRVAADYQWDELVQASAPIAGDPRRELDELWTIIYTSGTTGTPKGVMHTFRAPTALMENERTHRNLLIFGGDDHRFFSYLPLNHIAERIIVEGAALMTGGTISFAESLDTFARNLQETRPTLFMAVPRIWTKFQQGIYERLPPKTLRTLLGMPIVKNLVKRTIKKGLGLNHARITLTGAAPTPDPLKEWYQKLGITLQEVYAMTENCGGCTLMPRDAIKPGTVGRPLPNVKVKIDPETEEVLMSAPWMMQGYFRDEQRTREVLQNGWLRTGDRGHLTADGYLALSGRVNDTFKSAKGKFIVPAPMEWGFAENPLVEQVCVTGLALPQPMALLVLSEIGKETDRTEVEDSLTETMETINQSLSSFERLHRLVIMDEPWEVDNGLLTPTMKIRRNVLHQRYNSRFQEWYQHPQPIVWSGTAEAVSE
jgi:long-chain acyl-CoA synthetase